jgi:hypothetical protein
VTDVTDKSEGTETFDSLFGTCEVGGDTDACLNNNCRAFGSCAAAYDQDSVV